MQKVKGTFDIIDDMSYYHLIEKTMRIIAKKYYVKEIRTPHLEASELFHRGMGETTDVVSKETYRFTDRGGRDVTLRPEGTAGVVRAFIENKLYASAQKVQKYYYSGSMFRYERPQKGRFREFNTIGLEAFGSHHPALDVEVIDIAFRFLNQLGLTDLRVHVNALGDHESKARYKEALKLHLKPHIGSLCQDCQARYESNPLRILDCKVDAQQDVILNAPHPTDYLTEEDKLHFQHVRQGLEALNIPVIPDPRLVRGLDYYTHTVFEIKASTSLLGQQNTVCGGGRYDRLVEQLGGPSTPAVGFGFGVERLIVALKEKKTALPSTALEVYVAALEDADEPYVLSFITRLRQRGLSVERSFERSTLKALFKQSAHLNARYVCVIGAQESRDKTVQIKDQRTQNSWTVAEAEAPFKLLELISSVCEDCEEN